MNSFMKAKKEEKKSSSYEITNKSIEKEKVKEEKKISSTFTFKDFQKSINEKESKSKISTLSLTNSNGSSIVEKGKDKEIKEKLADKEIRSL